MLRILHLEDREDDAYLIQQAVSESHVEASFILVQNRAQFFEALNHGGFDLILADSSVPGIDSVEALKLAREKYPDVSILAVSGAVTAERAEAVLKVGASNYLSKDDPWQVIAAIRGEEAKLKLHQHNHAMMRLVKAVQELSLARDLTSIMAIVRQTARELTGADGATFVLRDGDKCYYAEENAIAPLWKGQRFPLQTCISGWAMLNRQAAVIPDIYVDPRIPLDAYRPTFVKSLVMVPIRTESPIGAIGNYWANQRQPTADEVQLLQTLANTTAVAMESVQVYNELEKRVKDRTAELEATNRELETFSYAVSHDLKAPLRSILGYTDIVLKNEAARLNTAAQGHLEKIRSSGRQMTGLIEDLLKLAKYSRTPLRRRKIDLSQTARETLARLSASSPDRKVAVHVADGLEVSGDPGLLQAAMDNLLSNAWKYSSKNPEARIEVGTQAQPDGSPAYYVRDNGAGFDMQAAQQLFQPFRRLHSDLDFPGTGIGLATVQRILQRHNGRIWVEAETGKGATFFFTLPEDQSPVPGNKDSQPSV